NFKHEFLKRTRKSVFVQRAVVLAGTIQSVFCRHPTEAWEGGGLESVFQIEVGFAVPFALQSKHRIRACLDSARDPAREVNSQEWKARIGSRVDQIANEFPPFQNDLVVLTA